tara:strand:+ start:6950 stop:7396 length:447 start_codon:yes stop_codon:yes gene_type:complete
MINQYTKLKKITLFELLRKIEKEKNDLLLINKMTLPSRKNQNEILENLILGIPFTIKGAANKKGEILISSLELNTLLFFFNGNINFKSHFFTEGLPLDINQIGDELKSMIESIEINIYYLCPSVDLDWTLSYIGEECTKEQLESFNNV